MAHLQGDQDPVGPHVAEVAAQRGERPQHPDVDALVEQPTALHQQPRQHPPGLRHESQPAFGREPRQGPPHRLLAEQGDHGRGVRQRAELAPGGAVEEPCRTEEPSRRHHLNRDPASAVALAHDLHGTAHDEARQLLLVAGREDLAAPAPLRDLRLRHQRLDRVARQTEPLRLRQQQRTERRLGPRHRCWPAACLPSHLSPAGVSARGTMWCAAERAASQLRVFHCDRMRGIDAVHAEGAGLHVRLEMMRERRQRLTQPGDDVVDALADGDPAPVERVPPQASTATQSDAGFDLQPAAPRSRSAGARPRRRRPGARPSAMSTASSRRRVRYSASACGSAPATIPRWSGGVVLGRVRGHADHEVRRGDLLAGVLEEMAQVVQSLGVADQAALAVERERPEIAVAAEDAGRPIRCQGSLRQLAAPTSSIPA